MPAYARILLFALLAPLSACNTELPATEHNSATSPLDGEAALVHARSPIRSRQALTRNWASFCLGSDPRAIPQCLCSCGGHHYGPVADTFDQGCSQVCSHWRDTHPEACGGPVTGGPYPSGN